MSFTRRDYRCRSGHHRPGCGGSTPPSCRVLADGHQGLQALQRCSGLLNRRARGSTVATHHFGGGTRIEKSMRGFGAARGESSFCLPLPPPFGFNAPVAQLPECDASNVGDEGESPSGSATFIYDFRFSIDDFCRVSPTEEAPRSERGG